MPYPLQNRPADLRESMYFPEIIRGIGTITRHFLKNFFFSRDANPDVLNRKRGGFGYSDNVTVQYPEEKALYAPAYRGLHRLVPREDGRPRCVACYMCATACPAQCIYIEAGEYADDPVEKYPVKFVIDELRCIVCPQRDDAEGQKHQHHPRRGDVGEFRHTLIPERSHDRDRASDRQTGHHPIDARGVLVHQAGHRQIEDRPERRGGHGHHRAGQETEHDAVGQIVERH